MLSADPLETEPCVSVCGCVREGGGGWGVGGNRVLSETCRGLRGVVGGVWGEEELSIS